MFATIKGFTARRGIFTYRGFQWFMLRKKTTKFNLLLRTLQLVQALVVIGYYGTYLNRAVQQGKYADGKWVFAVVVGGLAASSAISACLLVAFVHFRAVAICFAWDWMIFVLWTVLTGIFGSMYFNERVEMDGDIRKMKIAAGFDAAGLVLWLITALWSTYIFTKSPRQSLHKGEPKKLAEEMPDRMRG